MNELIPDGCVAVRGLDVVRRATVEHRLALTPTLELASGVLDLERY